MGGLPLETVTWVTVSLTVVARLAQDVLLTGITS